jgi:hypothetical protein
MTTAAKSVFVFGIYLMLQGILLMLGPDILLELLQLPDIESSWKVICGFAVFVLGYYYIRNALANLVSFFWFTVHVRLLQLIFFIVIYYLDIGTFSLVLLSTVESGFGIWTYFELKSSFNPE